MEMAWRLILELRTNFQARAGLFLPQLLVNKLVLGPFWILTDPLVANVKCTVKNTFLFLYF
jgi:hypothetical protein